MGPLRKSDLVAEDLLHRIVGGEFPAGSLLPREDELAAEAGVNRSAVREAVKRLEAQRLVKPVRRRGTIVLDALASDSPDVVGALLVPRGKGVDRALLSELLVARREVDAALCSLAARKRRAKDLLVFDGLLGEMEVAIDRPREYGVLDDRLSLAIARASGNRVFEMLVRWHHRIYARAEEVLLIARLPAGDHLASARQIVAGIRARDCEGVRVMVEKSHDDSSRRILQALKSQMALSRSGADA